MSYLFQTFQELINDPTIKGCLITKLNEETSHIIKTIDQELFEIETQEQAEFYVQKIELAIANFESSIDTRLKNNDSISREKLLKSCLDSLDNISHHIERTYSVYRDACKPVSRKTLIEISEKLEAKANRLRVLFDKNEISEKLKNVILRSIQNITHDQKKQVSQQKTEYVTSFIDELIQFLESLKQVEEQQLLQYLYILNFNNVALLCYICEHYKSMKGEIEDEKSLLDHLNRCKNKLNSMPQSIRKPYNSDLNDLKAQVQTWIQEEIVYVKKSIKQKAKEHGKNAGTKLKFNLSVDIVTCLFRLLHDAEITDSGANQTIRWIEQNISSKNQPHISRQSIQRKFYEKHPNKEPLKEMIIRLLNHLNRK